VAGVIQGKGENVSGVITTLGGVLASLGLLLLMAGTVYKECKPVKWRGTCLYEMSGPLYLKAEREKKNRGGQRMQDCHPWSWGKEWQARGDLHSR